MSKRTVAALVGGFALYTVIMVAAGLLGGHYLRDGEVDDLRGRLGDLTAEVGAAHREVGAANAEIDNLEGRAVELVAEANGLQARLAASDRQLGAKDAEIVGLEQRLSDSEMLTGEVDDVTRELDDLRRSHSTLLEAHEALQQQWSTVVPITSPDIAGDLLFLDRSVQDVFTTRAICSGSMEPNITCDDLVILYRPATISDLDIGDIIYFGKRSADCSGSLEGRFTLHRIESLVIGPDGISFRTRGDALSASDRCLVPEADVLLKLLTTVRDGRIGE